MCSPMMPTDLAWSPPYDDRSGLLHGCGGVGGASASGSGGAAGEGQWGGLTWPARKVYIDLGTNDGQSIE
jgi:hypothetical protein